MKPHFKKMDSSGSCLDFTILTADWIIMEQDLNLWFAKQEQILELFFSFVPDFSE